VSRCGWPATSSRRTRTARPSTSTDPLIRRLREEISDADRSLVEALNTRLRLVARLKRYKEQRGLEFVDLEREEWMLNYLLRANRGPLSTDGLRELFTEILDLTKREVARSEEGETA
jgi:chorismate mutase